MAQDNYVDPWQAKSEIDLSELDVVYTVKEGDFNEELRYSLRSLENIPHRRVVIVGYKPAWVKKVLHIPVRQIYPNKVVNTNKNWLTVANTKTISSKFVLMNDDMFFMKPVKNIPFGYMGDHQDFLEDYAAQHPSSYYTRVIRATDKRLKELGIKDPKCFELHTPVILSKRAVRLALDTPFQFDPINVRTVAISLMDVVPTLMPDVKYYPPKEQAKNPMVHIGSLPVISTSDRIWVGGIGDYVRSSFKEKGMYEKG